MLTEFEVFTLGLHELYRSMHKVEATEMGKYGLKGAYVKYLVALLRTPDGLTISQLCEVCAQDKAAVSRAVSELVGREFIMRENPRKNHYRAKLKLTERGVELARSVCLSGNSVFKDAAGTLTDEEKAQLFELMGKVSEKMHAIAMKKTERFER